MKCKWVLIWGLVFSLTSLAFGQSHFSTSLHATREGKRTAYKKENGGMELITNIPMDSLTCLKCHATTNADGTPVSDATYVPGCNDCHNFAAGNTVNGDRCYACHNRQTYERDAYPDSTAAGDVHRKKGMTCISCHSKQEVHGDDGVAYTSWLDSGAVKTQCTDCHPKSGLSVNTSHTIHAQTDKVNCLACHTTSIVSCINCHFETLLVTGKNRAMAKTKGFELLLKRNGQVYSGSFMTFTYKGKSNYILAPFRSHLIQKNAKTCADCHNNLGGTNSAINEYNSTGYITMAKWDSATKKINIKTGVIPIPPTWRTALKFDYATYTGDSSNMTSDPTKWVYLKSTSDNGHFFKAGPLDSATLAKLGVTRFTTVSVRELPAPAPGSYTLGQNYPNPFNPSTTIRYEIPHVSRVELKVFNLVGEEVATLVNQEQSAGTYECRFDGASLPSGLYFYRLRAASFTETRKFLLVR
jgi:hypothetical protein